MNGGGFSQPNAGTFGSSPSAPTSSVPSADVSASSAVESRGGMPVAPTLDASTVASVSGNQTLQSGVETENQAQAVRGQATIAYNDPTAAATGEAQSQVDGQIAERTPQSVQTARSDVAGGVAVYSDPEAAARAEAEGRADEEVAGKLPVTPNAADGSVSANVTVRSPKPDGTK